MRRLQIIFLNLIIIALFTNTLYKEYQRVGKFQWIDPERIKDHEEFGFTILAVGIIILALISLIYQLLDKLIFRKYYSTKQSGAEMILQIFCLFYATVLGFIGFIGTVAFLSKLDPIGRYNIEDVLFSLFLLSLLLYLSFLIFFQIFTINKSKRGP